MSKREIAIGSALVAFLGVGFLGGRWSAPEATAPERFATPGAVAAPSASPTPVVESAPPCGEAHGVSSTVESGEDLAQEGVPDRPLDLTSTLQAARAAFQAPGDAHVKAAAAAAANSLHARLARDPRALATALQKFRTLRDQAALAMLAVVLGRLADPEVEQAALQVAEQDSDPTRRAAAFEILDALDTPQARPLALQVLARETDKDLRRAALRAIPEPAGASRSDAAQLNGSLAAVLRSDPDPELRRRAATLLGRWATSLEGLRPVLRALAQDPKPGVRAGCAFACEISGRRDAAVEEALVVALDTKDEDPLVRENAWKALGALSPLGPKAHAAWQAYAKTRQAESEAVE